MVRRIDQNVTEIDSTIDSPPAKKHKKHKHKKHKKKREIDVEEEDIESDTSIDVSFEDDYDRNQFKLKNKSAFNQPGASTSAADLLKSQALESIAGGSTLVPSNTPPKPGNVPKKKKTKGKDSGTSSEEERWLDAIESGKLEEVDDELKKIKPKDPKLMTARQRAMYERGSDKEPAPGSELLMALPSGYKEKVMTEEAIQKAAIKSQKRKQMADEKREKDKKKTMDRLLKKQESKNIKCNQKARVIKKTLPMILYKNNCNEITLSLPPGVDFPLQARYGYDPPKPKICAVEGCSNIKKYNCSKTGVPLCSLECYKQNLSLLAS